MPMGFTRAAFRHDWDQGSYVQGGLLEGRIDDNQLEQLEQRSINICEKVIDRFDDIIVHFSGGLDILVVAHMLMRIDADVTLVNFRSIEQFPSCVDFVQGMADAFGMELDEVVRDDQNMEWVKANEDRVLWPTFEVKDELYHDTYRNASHDYHVENNVDAFITGRRNEHNITPKTVLPDKEAYDRVNPFPSIDEPVAYQVNPINTWTFEFVAAYLDKHSIPVMPGYRYSEVGCEYPWHRAECENPWTDFTKPPEQMWWDCRELTVKYGYTEFWENHILQHYPRGESMAGDWAADTDQSMLSIEDGYDSGADAEPVPYPSGPVSSKHVVNP